MSAGAPVTVPPTQSSVSVLVVVRNAVDMLPECVQSIWAQTCPALEILIIDGNSTDGTAARARQLAEVSPVPMTVLDNPDRILAPGWNLGIERSRGRYVLRVDAHSRLAPDYIQTCLANMRSAQALEPMTLVVGGRRLTAATGASPWARAIAAAQQSRWGVGRTAYRFAQSSRWVDTIAMGLYDRRAFELAGRFDESLGRTEDNDFHARLRARGGRLYLAAETSSTYLARDTLAALFRQMYQSGWWIGATIRQQGRFPFSARHIAPAMLVVGLGGLAIASGLRIPAALPLLLGFVLAYALMTVAASWSGGCGETARRATALVGMHTCYGGGTWVGLLQAASSRRRPSNATDGSPQRPTA